jgi:hypothetical protein
MFLGNHTAGTQNLYCANPVSSTTVKGKVYSPTLEESKIKSVTAINYTMMTSVFHCNFWGAMRRISEEQFFFTKSKPKVHLDDSKVDVY